MYKNNKSLGIVDFCMHYYKLVILITAAMVGIGIYAIVNMPKQEFPPITIRQGMIVGVYPGATSSQVEEQIAKPLEKFLFTYKEINKDKTYTMSQDGICYAMVELNDNVNDRDPVWSKIKLGINNELKPTLSPGVLAVIVNDNFGDTSALLISLQSKEKTYRELEDYLDILEGKLRRIKSVSNLRCYGLQKERIGVYINKQKLNSYNISYLQVMNTLQMKGLTTVSGAVDGEEENLPIHVTSSMDTEQNIANQVILALPGQQTVRLKDIATIKREYPEPNSYIQNNDTPCILLSLEMVEGNNIVEYGNQVDKVLNEFKTVLPTSVHLERIADSPKVVRTSVTSFIRDLFMSIAVVIFVMMLLFPFRSALVSATSIPISIFITLAIMYFSHIPLNTVTLAALIVVLGMIVDNSIIVIDAYVSNLDKGMSRWHAAVYSAREYAWSIFLATVCICSIFYPLRLTFTGLFRDFIEDFPNTMTISLMTSFVVAMLLIPFLEFMLIKKGLIARAKEREAKGKKKRKSILNYVEEAYVWILTRCFRTPVLSLVIGILIIAGGAWMMFSLPKRMLPYADRDQFAVEIFLPKGSTLNETKEVCDSLSHILLRDSRVKSITKFVGTTSPRFQTTYAPNIPGKNYGQFIVNTTSIEDDQDILAEYTDKYEQYFPNAYCHFKELQYQKVAVPIEVRYYGDNIDSIMNCANKLMTHMHDIPELTWIHSNYETMRPTLQVNLDPVKSARFGISKTSAEFQIMAMQEGVSAGTLWEGDYPLNIHIEQQKNGKESVNDLADSYLVAGIPSVRVPLRQIATIEPSWDYSQIVRRNGVRTVSVLANVKFHSNQNKAFAKVLNLHKKYVAPTMPSGVKMEIGGTIEDDNEIIPPIVKGISIAVLIIFTMLLINFKKISLALASLSSILLCILGAAVGLKIFGLQFGITSILGLISLMGCIVRNAILIFEHAEDKRLHERMSAKDAAFDAGKRRMLPIFLTSATTGVGVIPMILSHSSLWMPMGVVICFGTFFSMILCVILLPLIYTVIFRNEKPKKMRLVSQPKVLLLVGMVALGSNAFAQNTKTESADTLYNLNACIKLAVKHNYTLVNAKKDIELSKQQQKEAFTKYFPNVSAGLTAYQAHTPLIEESLTLPIPGVPAIPVAIMKKGYCESITAVQPIFTGGQIINANKLARVGKESNTLQAIRTEKQVRVTTEAYFWRIINLHEKRNTLQSQVLLLNQLHHDVELAVKVGVTNRNDLLRIELQQSRLKSGLVTVNHAIEISRLALAQYIGINNHKSHFYIEMQDFPQIGDPMQYHISAYDAVQNREGYALLGKQVKANKLQRSMELGKRLPTVAIGASICQYNLLDETNRNALVFATVKVPISDWWGGSHAISQKRIAIEKAQNNLKNGRELMELETTQTWNELTESYDQVNIAKQAIESSKENLRLNKDTYQAGTTTIADLLDAQMILQESENQQTESKTKYMVTLAKYKRITGQ